MWFQGRLITEILVPGVVEKSIGNDVFVGKYETVDCWVWEETGSCSLIEKYGAVPCHSLAWGWQLISLFISKGSIIRNLLDESSTLFDILVCCS